MADPVNSSGRHAVLPLEQECSTCEGSGVIRQEGQIGAPGSGGVFTCPGCGPQPVESVDQTEGSEYGRQ